jgi:isocitrate dehydrogenase
LLGQLPQQFKPVKYAAAAEYSSNWKPSAPAEKKLVGVDVFLDWTKGTPDQLGDSLKGMSGDGLKLYMITNRGVKVWPDGAPETFCTDHWRCRFMGEGNATSHDRIVKLLERFDAAGFDFIKTENLYTFNGELGYSLGQGQ